MHFYRALWLFQCYLFVIHSIFLHISCISVRTSVIAFPMILIFICNSTNIRKSNEWKMNEMKQNAINCFIQNKCGDWFESLQVFILASIVIFGLCSPNLRIHSMYLVVLVSILWTVVLSLIRGEYGYNGTETETTMTTRDELLHVASATVISNINDESDSCQNIKDKDNTRRMVQTKDKNDFVTQQCIYFYFVFTLGWLSCINKYS